LPHTFLYPMLTILLSQVAVVQQPIWVAVEVLVDI
jgi:hypothetical protein